MMFAFKKIIYVLLVGASISTYCMDDKNLPKDTKGQSSSDKLTDKKNYLICEKRAKLAPTAYSAKRIKKNCLREYGIKSSLEERF
jgi:hypothetical protein